MKRSNLISLISLLILQISLFACKEQIIDERGAGSEAGNQFPADKYNDQIVPNDGTDDTNTYNSNNPSSSLNPTTKPMSDQEQLDAMQACKNKALVYLVHEKVVHCLPEVKLATSCDSGSLAQRLAQQGDPAGLVTLSKAFFGLNTLLTVLDQCGVIEDAGLMLTRAQFKLGTKLITAHHYEIFCSKNTAAKGYKKCLDLKADLDAETGKSSQPTNPKPTMTSSPAKTYAEKLLEHLAKVNTETNHIDGCDPANTGKAFYGNKCLTMQECEAVPAISGKKYKYSYSKCVLEVATGTSMTSQTSPAALACKSVGLFLWREQNCVTKQMCESFLKKRTSNFAKAGRIDGNLCVYDIH